MKDELLALANRVEGLSAPCRETDLRVKAAIYGGVAFHSPHNGYWCLYAAGTAEPRSGKLFERPSNVPHSVWAADNYTASMDAAMTLVTIGFIAQLSDLAANGLPGCCICYDTTTSPTLQVWGVSYDGKNRTERLARAVTAAALRARAAVADAG